jgi:hypothetical protein
VYAVQNRHFLVLLGGRQPDELGEEAAHELLWPVSHVPHVRPTRNFFIITVAALQSYRWAIAAVLTSKLCAHRLCPVLPQSHLLLVTVRFLYTSCVQYCCTALTLLLLVFALQAYCWATAAVASYSFVLGDDHYQGMVPVWDLLNHITGAVNVRLHHEPEQGVLQVRAAFMKL